MLTQQLIELEADEGLRLVVYDDATGLPIRPGTHVIGHPTIGIGRALDVHGITEAEARTLNGNDVTEVEAALFQLAWFKALDPVRQGVVTNLAFNMGVRGLLSFRNMIAIIIRAETEMAGAQDALARADYSRAADQLLDSKWATQVQPSRRDRLIQQMRTGEL